MANTLEPDTLDDLKRDVVGSDIHALDTPCLLLDWAKAQRNIRKMADFFRDRRAKLRPHFKNHKCITLARHQMEAGSAVGMTCAKMGEAEVLAAHGCDDILIANQVVGRRKVDRLVSVASRVRKIAVAVDDVSQAAAISEAATRAGTRVGVLVEVDNGMGRCGAAPGEPSLELAQQIVMLPGLRFDGIQSYEGHVVYINDREQREKLTRTAFDHVRRTRELIEEHGIHVPVVSGGSTGTYNITGTMDFVDEIQAGTYVTMDWRYAEVVPEFEVALSVLAAVISRPRSGAAVLDLGVKGGGGEFGLPRIKGHPDVEIPFFLAEEHLAIRNAPAWRVGQTVEVLPSHACTTCNLYRHMFVHEGERVVDVWPIEASGKLA